MLLYTIASLDPAHVPALVKPPIIQVYSQRQNTPVLSPTQAASSYDVVNSGDLPIALRKDKRHCVCPISSFCSYNHLSSHSYCFIASLDSNSLLNNVHEGLSHLVWCRTMIEEMNALDDNGTWDLVRLPIAKKAIGCCQVFVVKVNPNGSVAMLKACLVAKGS